MSASESGGNEEKIKEELAKVQILLDEQSKAYAEAEALIQTQREYIAEQASQLDSAAAHSAKYRRTVKQLLDDLDKTKPEPTTGQTAAKGLAIVGGVYAVAKATQAGIKWWRGRNQVTA